MRTFTEILNDVREKKADKKLECAKTRKFNMDQMNNNVKLLTDLIGDEKWEIRWQSDGNKANAVDATVGVEIKGYNVIIMVSRWGWLLYNKATAEACFNKLEWSQDIDKVLVEAADIATEVEEKNIFEKLKQTFSWHKK
jgi:hypothetical protein